MNHSDYLDISNIELIENFSGSGAVGGGNGTGSGSITNTHSSSSSSRSPTLSSQGGGKQYGSYGYASISPIGAMSGISDPQPNSISGLGVIKNGAKIGTFTGGSFGGNGKYVVGFPGIKSGSNLPASSSPSLYMKPKLTSPHPTFFDAKTVQDVTLPYGHIEKHITPSVPGPRITYKYDNVGCNFATELRPTLVHDSKLENKNLRDIYNYREFNYYQEPSYNYEDLTQKEADADYVVNTIQNQLATQFMEEDMKKEADLKEDIEEQDEDALLKLSSDIKTKTNIKEHFKSGNQTCGRNTILIILAVVLIIYIILNIPTN